VNAMKSGRKFAGSSRFAEQFAASPGAWTATKGPASQMPFPGDAVVTRAFVGVGAKWRIGHLCGMRRDGYQRKILA
jgi:hypothetical protein